VEITLQVVWDEDQEAVRRHISRAAASHPGTRIEWIAFGQGTAGFQMETSARNARNVTLADNAGQLPGQVSPVTGRLVSTWNKEEGSNELRSDPLDTRRITGAMKIPESADAGQYLCESILYELLDQSKSRTPDNHLDAGRFFHTPFAPSHTETDDFVRKLARVLFAGRR
jgi:pyrrolidone-carboxylate peptidase